MQAERIALLLPEVYRRAIVPGTPLAALLAVMEQQHAPVEQILAELPDYFDPHRTPDRFVPFLARWVDLDRWLNDGSGEFDAGTGRLRQVVAAAAQLSRIRGTADGLRQALEIATGIAGVRIDEDAEDAAGRPRPFHIVVSLPRSAAAFEPLVRRIVQQEKPAHVTAEVVFSDGEATAPPAPPPASAPLPPVPPLPADLTAPREPAFPGTEPAVDAAPSGAGP